jgi:hypothetical protein
MLFRSNLFRAISKYVVGQGNPKPISFFPSTSRVPTLLGVVELKRSDTTVLRIRRKEVLQLASDATTAVAQARAYMRDLERTAVAHELVPLMLGDENRMFLIMGLSSEIASKGER